MGRAIRSRSRAMAATTAGGRWTGPGVEKRRGGWGPGRPGEGGGAPMSQGIGAGWGKRGLPADGPGENKASFFAKMMFC